MRPYRRARIPVLRCIAAKNGLITRRRRKNEDTVWLGAQRSAVSIVSGVFPQRRGWLSARISACFGCDLRQAVRRKSLPFLPSIFASLPQSGPGRKDRRHHCGNHRTDHSDSILHRDGAKGYPVNAARAGRAMSWRSRKRQGLPGDRRKKTNRRRPGGTVFGRKAPTLEHFARIDKKLIYNTIYIFDGSFSALDFKTNADLQSPLQIIYIIPQVSSLRSASEMRR